VIVQNQALMILARYADEQTCASKMKVIKVRIEILLKYVLRYPCYLINKTDVPKSIKAVLELRFTSKLYYFICPKTKKVLELK
jgi:hypothetical protein